MILLTEILAELTEDEAAELAALFDTSDPWTADMHTIAHSLRTDIMPAPVSTEPWKTIYKYLQFVDADHPIEEQFYRGLAHLTPQENAVLGVMLGIEAQVADKQQQSGAIPVGGTSAAAGQPQQGHIKSAEYVRALYDLGYSFRANVLDDSIEVNGECISDLLTATIRTEMRDLGYHRVNVMEDAYWREANLHRHHPIRDYLKTLAWDGKPHIATMAGYFVDKYGRFHDWIRRWMIGAVARVYEPTQNRMLVLDSDQGLGKSFWVSWLASPMPRHMIEGPIDPANKDSWVRLINKWVWEVAELGSTTRKADREALKHFLSVQFATVRPPYGKFDLHKPALASFIGTVNNESGILSDPTGNRRFMISHLTDIDWSYSKDLEPDDLWAEAHEAYLAGEAWHLSGAELKAAQDINDLYEVEDAFEGVVVSHFQIDYQNPTWTPTSDLLDHLYGTGLTGNRRSNSIQLGNCLNAMGFERARRSGPSGKKVWGYIGIWL